MEELAGPGVAARGAAGLNGWSRERMCQACWEASTAAQRSVSGPGLGDASDVRALAGLLDSRGQARVADELAGGREAADVTDLGGDREAEWLADAGDRHQQPGAVTT